MGVGMSGEREINVGRVAHEPAHRVRHDGWTGERQRAFLDALARVGNVRDACRAVRLSTTSAYRIRRADPAFGQAWDAALKRASTSLEAVAFQRAVEGVEEAVIRDGVEVSRKRRYSDALLRLLLQASDPEKYGRTGGQGGVQAREAVEARVKEIEQAAYRRAWIAFAAEYRFHAEPDLYNVWTLTRLMQMHLRMCDNPWCRDCHPERGEAESLHPNGHRPAEDHDPIEGFPIWWDAESERLTAEILRARTAGEAPRIEPAIVQLPEWSESVQPPR